MDIKENDIRCDLCDFQSINGRCADQLFVRPSLLPAIHWGDSSWRAHYAFKSTEGGIIKVRVHSAKTGEGSWSRGTAKPSVTSRRRACLRWLAASPRSVFANQFVCGRSGATRLYHVYADWWGLGQRAEWHLHLCTFAMTQKVVWFIKTDAGDLHGKQEADDRRVNSNLRMSLHDW